MPEYALTTDAKITVHPGDIVQITDQAHPYVRGLAVVTECHSWGIGVNVNGVVGGALAEAYERLKPGQFAVCGVARLVSGAVAAARRQSMETDAEIQRERAAQ